MNCQEETTISRQFLQVQFQLVIAEQLFVKISDY